MSSSEARDNQPRCGVRRLRLNSNSGCPAEQRAEEDDRRRACREALGDEAKRVKKFS